MACDACGAAIEVPASLGFPGYAEVHRDRMLAMDIEVGLAISVVLCCAPASAICWWIASGAIQRAADADRPVDPVLVRVRGIARVATMFQILLWAAGFASAAIFR